MAVIKLNSKLKGNTAFETIIDGHSVITDKSIEGGGNNYGPRPKALLLSGLVGCMGIDIMMILEKMKIEIDDLNVDIETESRDEDPKIYKYINLVFKFKGKNLPLDKLNRAIELSHDKYCGVSAMLEKVVPINIKVVIED